MERTFIFWIVIELGLAFWGIAYLATVAARGLF